MKFYNKIHCYQMLKVSPCQSCVINGMLYEASKIYNDCILCVVSYVFGLGIKSV